jgi:hypothetical protein
MATEQEVLAGLIRNANEQIDRANTAKRMANDWAEQKKLALPFQDVGTERSAAGGVDDRGLRHLRCSCFRDLLRLSHDVLVR